MQNESRIDSLENKTILDSNLISSRRSFIKTSALTGAGIAIALSTPPILKAFEKKGDGKDKLLAYEGKWVPSTCQGCTTWCAIEFFVQNGRVVKVRGNQLSKSNEGYCCPKGHLQIMELYDPDRVKVPMKRTNPKKGVNENPGFVPITWDEALDTIATKMMELRAANEPQKFMLLRGRYSTGQTDFPYTYLPKIFGTPNYISHSAMCAEAEKFGPYYTEGLWGYRDYDLLKTKYLVLWGSDPLSSNRQIPNVINKMGTVLDQATVVTVDPRMSASAVKSHEWVPIKPGEDGALASALAHVILTEGLWSKEFVGTFNGGTNLFVAGQNVDESSFTETQTSGLVKWWNLELKDKTPDWAEKITLIPKEQIIRIAKGMGAAAPNTCVWLGPGPVMSPRGAYISMAIHALNGLLGSIDNEGGTLRNGKVTLGSFPSDANYIDQIAKDGAAKKKIDQRGTKNMPAMASGKSGGGVVTNNVANALIKSDPYDIKVCIGYWCNFNFSGTQGQRWDEALSKLPFFAHITTNASEMTHFADIVLPAAHPATQKWSSSDDFANLYSFHSIQQPIVKKIWDEKADENEIMWLLAEKLKVKGFSNFYDYLSKEFKDPESSALPTTAEEFAEIATKIKSKPAYDTIGGWEKFKEIGIVSSSKYTYKKTWGAFGTVTKKFEFYSETLKKVLGEHATKYTTTIDDIMTSNNYIAQGELAFVPHYEPPMRKGDIKDYPFEFVDYKSKLNREGRSANIAWYHEFHKVDTGDESWDDVIKLNPKDGAKLGIKDGDLVKISSLTGSIEVKAKLWEGVREGTVAKAYGQGHKYYGKIASLDFSKGTPRGGNNNDVIPDEYERFSGSTCRNGGFFGVKIEKATTGIVENNSTSPSNLIMGNIYPNPAKDYSTINFTLTIASNVKIRVFNTNGKAVTTIANGMLEAGSHTLRIDTSILESGMYICNIEANGMRNAVKLVVAK
ncbi:MAG: anaerobic selenocysteine-containing dehydrogenase [Ignavibacteria bacterium]|nr:anaerobic selenocysteine-containing dehydrogenase [Ignavibacteria bacterium]